MGKHFKTNDDYIIDDEKTYTQQKESSKNKVNNTHNSKSKKKSKKNSKKKHNKLRIFLLILIILGIFIGKRIYDADGNLLAALLGHNRQTLENLDKLQVLILGESTGMSDTIIVASYDPKTQEAALLTIPRDTFTGESKSSANYYHKINSLYNYGETPEKTLAAVNEITGLNIQYYIIVDTEALIKLVDTIEGLDFNVPIDMNYDDSTQDLHIHLSAGYQKLNGDQVEQLVRFRHNNDGSSYPFSYANGVEDHGRSKTQRDVILAIAKQTLQFKNVTEISKIIDIFKEYVDTNMDLDAIKDYVPYAVSMNMSNVKVDRIPGQDDVANGIWFFFYDEEETKKVVDELFYGITEQEDAKITNDDNSSNDN